MRKIILTGSLPVDIRRRTVQAAAKWAYVDKRYRNDFKPELVELLHLVRFLGIHTDRFGIQHERIHGSERNIGAYWSSPKSMTEGNFIELEEGMRCLGLMYMGKIDENNFKSERENISSKIEWINE